MLPELYVAALSSVFVHQLSTCMDLVNLGAAGARTVDGDQDLAAARASRERASREAAREG